MKKTIHASRVKLEYAELDNKFNNPYTDGIEETKQNQKNEPEAKRDHKSPRKVNRVDDGGMRIRSRSNLRSDQSKRRDQMLNEKRAKSNVQGKIGKHSK